MAKKSIQAINNEINKQKRLSKYKKQKMLRLFENQSLNVITLAQGD